MELRRPVSTLGWAGLIAASLFTPATAGPMGSLTIDGTKPTYNVTDLGAGYTFAKAADGSTTSVTGGNGQTFAFSKFPVTYTDPNSNFLVTVLHDQVGWYDFKTGIDSNEFVVAKNKFGSIGYSEGYYAWPNPEYKALAVFTDSTGTDRSPDWATSNPSVPRPLGTNNAPSPSWWNGSPSPTSLIQDFNTSGQVVGSNQSQSNQAQAVEDGVNPISKTGSVYDVLNKDIASELASRINLTGALFIDDLGRIIAEDDTNGVVRDYLLTPTYLPEPAPEPSTLSILGVALAGLGVRAWRRRKAFTIR